jgi:hypothetical protein
MINPRFSWFPRGHYLSCRGINYQHIIFGLLTFARRGANYCRGRNQLGPLFGPLVKLEG